MKKKPLVSIIIASYNKQKFVKRCIRSCINQTYKNIEIIFVDDNSSDYSYEEAKKFKTGCTIYLKDVPKPENYGVVKIKNNKINLITEKPKKFISPIICAILIFVPTPSTEEAKRLDFLKSISEIPAKKPLI